MYYKTYFIVEKTGSFEVKYMSMGQIVNVAIVSSLELAKAIINRRREGV